ncbi:MAG: hypothetical protein Q4F75_06115 [Pseudomonadota bacterium]|nr:hypothetical protein [Pseudomonadota bacterium]
MFISRDNDYVQKDLKDYPGLYEKEKAEEYKKAKEMIDEHKGIKAVIESPQEEVDNKSNDLKALYKEAAKMSGAVKADVLAMAKIVK